ncbi:MAG: hypothetical protein ABIM74_05880 [candidate division WOR-3 bacterium]
MRKAFVLLILATSLSADYLQQIPLVNEPELRIDWFTLSEAHEYFGSDKDLSQDWPPEPRHFSAQNLPSGNLEIPESAPGLEIPISLQRGEGRLYYNRGLAEKEA